MDDLGLAELEGAGEAVGVCPDAGQRNRPLRVRAEISSTGKIPGTTSAGGSIQTGR